MRSLFLATALATAFAASPAFADKAGIAINGESFVVTTSDGGRLAASDLVGATMTMTTPEGMAFDLRIDSASPAKERPSLSLLSLSVRDAGTGQWRPFCQKDAYGRAAGFPVAGAWDGNGHFIADKSRWFITCTSGSQGKCILFGYDPWGRGPHGEDLVPYYEACQHMVRADYDGSRWAHTRNGTIIDIWDHLGIQTDAAADDPAFHFEAGWSARSAVCVARTRWPDLLSRDTLVRSAPRLDGPCNEAIATAEGALLFNRAR